MDNVNDIIRMVTRGFYDIRSVLIMDALLIHKVLSDDDMRLMLDIQQKEIRGLCSKLKEDHILKDHLQKEEGNTYRPITKTYYYIHYTEAVDAIKWKVHQTVKKIKDQMIADAYPQGYICPQCGARYSPLDAVALSNSLGIFICSVCDGELQEDDTSDEAKAKQATQARLMSQLQPIIESLRRIDDTFIPDNTFESSLSEARPPPAKAPPGHFANGSSNFYDTGNGYGGSFNNYASSSASLTQQNGAASLQVNITSKSETAALEKQAQEAKARHAEENALPTWHLESTVGKTMYAGDGDIVPDMSDTTHDDKSKINLDIDSKAGVVTNEGSTAKTEETNSDIAAYFARLEATRKAEEEEEEEEEEDDDDAEFEDVVPPADVTAKSGTAQSNDDGDDDDDDDDEEFEDI